MRRIRTTVVAGLVISAAVLPTVLTAGDDDTNRLGQNWWVTEGARAGTANFQPDADLFTVCDERSDGYDVVGTVFDGQAVIYSIVADGGTGDCERRHSGDGVKYDLIESRIYDFEVCLTLVDNCKIRKLPA
ncbi:MAG: hypothetical protein ACRD0P_03620 [Stackebrandtia sp.]